MKKLFILALCLLTPALSAAEEKEFSVPSDPHARFFVLEKEGGGGIYTIVTKRVGTQYISFSKRLYDCAENTVKYLGSGDSLDAMEKSKPDERMGPIIKGSIAYYVALQVCQ